MPATKRGGKGSVHRTIAADHRRLDALFTETRVALRGPGAGDAFARLRHAVETHLAQEDRLYYPAVWALRPEEKPALQAFLNAHELFRGLLDAIDGLLARRAWPEAEAAFTAFGEAFGRHEAGEEALLRRLERTVAGGAGSS